MADADLALVLQGGGALGAYQAGAIEALTEAGAPIDWIAGISIGAINAAIVAGNAPEGRVPALRRFWRTATSGPSIPDAAASFWPRAWINEASAAGTTLTGVPGFFRLRLPPAGAMPAGSDGARSYYDTAPLAETLAELVDFDRIARGRTRLSVGAVNVETGNMTWFDSEDRRLGPRHVMASGALPPGFPAIEIDGAHYWDGGLVSNTPLQYVLDDRAPEADIDVLQVDLFDARGALPGSVWTSEAREKDIRFSSRTRFNTDMMRRLHERHEAGRRLWAKLPDALRADPDARAALAPDETEPRIRVAHLIYRQDRDERGSKDYEFSRRSMEEHWAAGHADAARTLGHPDWMARHADPSRIRVYDLSR